jgi:hypothetical protein
MSNLSHFDKSQILSSAILGFEFEFFSEMVRGRIVESLSKLLGKKIILTNKYHSKTPVSSDTFKLEPDYSGGSKMNELITGPLPYAEAIPILIKVLRWIDENGWTNDKCAFQFSISFDKFDRSIRRIEELDKLQFILGIDEGMIYSKFGNRTNNVYAKSIKRVVPRNRFSMLENITTIDPKIFKIPDEKYYGANFTKIPKGYMEIRYLGGRDYQKKINSIREIIDYVLMFTSDILSGRRGYTKTDLENLKSMMKDYTKVVRSFSDPEAFFMNFPDFHLLVDLKGYEENIKTYFPVIRDKIFDLIVEGNVRTGFFNYDTSNGRFQLKDAKIKDASFIDNLDLIDCKIRTSKVDNCRLFGCEIKNSEVHNSEVVNSNKITDSKVQNTSVSFGNKLFGCFIDSPMKMVDCEINGGVIRKADLGRNANVSDSTEKVKDFNEIRQSRFVTDSRLKDLNDPLTRIKFKNQNY